MTLVAPRIVNDLPYVSTVNHEIHFRNPAVLLMHRFLFIQLFFQQSLSISNTDFISLIV